MHCGVDRSVDRRHRSGCGRSYSGPRGIRAMNVWNRKYDSGLLDIGGIGITAVPTLSGPRE